MSETIDAVLDRIEAQQPHAELIELGPEESSLSFLQKIYRNVSQPMSRRIRAAIEALPFEHPKLSAVATASMNGNDFAALLDRAIERSGKVQEVKQIETSANDLALAQASNNEFDNPPSGTAELGSCLTDATREGRSRRAVRDLPLCWRPSVCSNNPRGSLTRWCHAKPPRLPVHRLTAGCCCQGRMKRSHCRSLTRCHIREILNGRKIGAALLSKW